MNKEETRIGTVTLNKVKLLNSVTSRSLSKDALLSNNGLINKMLKRSNRFIHEITEILNQSVIKTKLNTEFSSLYEYKPIFLT